MSKEHLQAFDLAIRADNGLRRGRTTGTCATAAVKAALICLEFNEQPNEVQITLPDLEHYLVVPIESIEANPDGSVSAQVIKYAGDDPDNTDGALIKATVKRNNSGQIRFLAGPGIGIVTEPGIRVPIGEPAINPAPREMMLRTIEEVLDDGISSGYDLTISCDTGEEIAKRTFNPRLGILGGISILGTTGIVEPMSLAAYKASIEVYIRVALGGNATDIAFLPGNIGIGFAKTVLALPKKRIVAISNFLGFALESAQQSLEEENSQLETLWILGHPGKLAKVLDGVWDTHSKKSDMAMKAIAQVASQCGFSSNDVKLIENSNTVEAIFQVLQTSEDSKRLWIEVEKRIARMMQEKTPSVNKLEVRLFSMNGTALGEAA